jgi:hypothetical protein
MVLVSNGFLVFTCTYSPCLHKLFLTISSLKSEPWDRNSLPTIATVPLDGSFNILTTSQSPHSSRIWGLPSECLSFKSLHTKPLHYIIAGTRNAQNYWNLGIRILSLMHLKNCPKLIHKPSRSHGGSIVISLNHFENFEYKKSLYIHVDWQDFLDAHVLCILSCTPEDDTF